MSAAEVWQYVQLTGLIVVCGMMIAALVFVVTYLQNVHMRKQFVLLAKHYGIAFNDAPRDFLGLSMLSAHGTINGHSVTVEVVTKRAYANVMGAGGVSTPTNVAFTIITIDGKKQPAPLMGTAYRRKRTMRLIDAAL